MLVHWARHSMAVVLSAGKERGGWVVTVGTRSVRPRGSRGGSGVVDSGGSGGSVLRGCAVVIM